MTNVEAIIVLKYGMKYRNPKNDTEKDRNEALDMAISALSENKGEDRPKGEWDINCQGIVFCSHCKKVFNHNYDIDYMESHFKFCPNCGADMRGINE